MFTVGCIFFTACWTKLAYLNAKLFMKSRYICTVFTEYMQSSKLVIFDTLTVAMRLLFFCIWLNVWQYNSTALNMDQRLDIYLTYELRHLNRIM